MSLKECLQTGIAAILAMCVCALAGAQTAQPGGNVPLKDEWKGQAFYRWKEDEALVRRAFPGQTITLIVTIQAPAGEAYTFREAAVDPLLLGEVSPGDREVIDAGTDYQKNGQDWIERSYACPIEIKAGAKPREYPITLKFVKVPKVAAATDPNADNSVQATTGKVLLPVAKASAPPISVTNTDPIAVSLSTDKIVFNIKNEFPTYPIDLTGITVTSPGGFIEPASFTCNKTLQAIDGAARVEIPLRAKWSSIFMAPAATSKLHISFSYKDPYNRQFESSTPPVEVASRVDFGWFVMLVSVALGAGVGAVIRYSFDQATKTDRGISRLTSIAWSVFFAIFVLAAARLAGVELVNAKQQLLASADSPFAVLLSGLAVGLIDPAAIVAKIRAIFGPKSAAPSSP